MTMCVPKASSVLLTWMNVVRLLEPSADDLAGDTRIPLLVTPHQQQSYRSGTVAGIAARRPSSADRMTFSARIAPQVTNRTAPLVAT